MLLKMLATILTGVRVVAGSSAAFSLAALGFCVRFFPKSNLFDLTFFFFDLLLYLWLHLPRQPISFFLTSAA